MLEDSFQILAFALCSHSSMTRLVEQDPSDNIVASFSGYLNYEATAPSQFPQSYFLFESIRSAALTAAGCCLDRVKRVYYCRHFLNYLCRIWQLEILLEICFARVAELADALDSGSSDRKAVQVQVLSRARMSNGFFIRE